MKIAKPLRGFFIAVFFLGVISGLAMAKDPPEKIEIKALENLYEPSIFEHKRHVDATEKCQECHHKAQNESNVPPCSSCHKIPYDSDNLSVIGLKGALHIQCMECHKKNEIDNSCVSCHKKK